jgi:hypothetical protein
MRRFSWRATTAPSLRLRRFALQRRHLCKTIIKLAIGNQYSTVFSVFHPSSDSFHHDLRKSGSIKVLAMENGL